MPQPEMTATRGAGLDADTQMTVRALTQLIWDQPVEVNALISSYGEDPSPDPAVKTMQLLMVAGNDTDEGFRERYYDHIDGREFLGGLMGKLKGFLGKVKGGGKKVGNFVKNIFKGKKKKLAQAQAKLDAGEPLTKKEQKWLTKWGAAPGSATAGYPGGVGAPIYKTGVTETDEEKEKREKEEKKRKMELNAWRASTAFFGIAFIILLGIVLTRD